MTNRTARICLAIHLGILMTACSTVGTGPPSEIEDSEPSHVASEVDSSDSQPTATATQESTATQSPTSTSTRIPTEEPTPTPEPVSLSVSANTNCRLGQGLFYERSGTLLIGEQVEVLARSTVPDYWYIENPSKPGEFCWLWGEYATLNGEVEALPILTPLPSPTPGPLITIDYAGTINCKQKFAFFIVRNYGPFTFMTAERTIVDLDTGKTLYPATLDRHPFAPLKNHCVPGHENEVYPGDVAYIYVPLVGSQQGHRAQAIIRVCTEDYLQGLCHTQWINFRFP